MNGKMRVKTPTLSKFATETTDLGEGRIRAIVSTEAKDRDGDIIRQSGWDLKRFQKHPILLVDHNYADITKEIGKWESMKINGNTMVGEARYFIGKGNEVADWAYFLAADEQMAAFSVGFLPDWEKATEIAGGDDAWPHYEFNGQELLEVSQVTVPSNPEALQLALSGVLLKSKALDPLLRERMERVLTSVESSLLAGNETRIDASALFGPEVINALAEEIAARLEESLEIMAGLEIAARLKTNTFFRQIQEDPYSALDKHLEATIREAINARH